MKIPDAAFKRMKNRLWAAADGMNWQTLSDQDKSVLYEQWIRDREVGGVLSRYLDTGNIRVYIKDTIMKPYGRDRIKDFAPIAQLLSLDSAVEVTDTYIKPHGKRLADGKVICWGLARDWKAIILAVFERAYSANASVPYAAVMMYPSGKYQQPDVRRMIDAAARKLGLAITLWHDHA